MAKGTRSSEQGEKLVGSGSDREKADRGDNIDKGDNFAASSTFSYGHKSEKEFDRNKFAKHNEKEAKR